MINKILYLIISINLISGFVFAGSNLAIEGKIVDASGNPLVSNDVDFELSVYDSSGACIIYRETHAGIDMSGSDGYFSLSLGSGVLNYGGSFSNNLFAAGNFNCESGGSVTQNDLNNRKVGIKYSVSGGSLIALDKIDIASVAVANVANTLSGKGVGEFLLVKDDASYDLNQSNLENIFSTTNYPKLTSILSNYTFSGGNQIIQNLATPTNSGDATNKGYVDSYVGGNAINTGALVAGDSGKVLKWDGTKWVAGAESTTDNTKLPLDGSSAMSGNLNMGNQNITNANNITVGGDATISGGIGVTNGINSSGNISVLNQTDVRFGDNDGTANYVAIQAPVNLAADITFTLPDGHGSGGQVLSNDGSGNLSWISSVQSGTGAGDVIVNSALPNCNANQKLQMSAGPVFTLSCVADIDTGITELTGDVTTAIGNGSQAATIAANAVTSAKINDGEIVNADISASAAIADSKLATISTAGKVSNSATTATNANTASAIVARDASGNFSAGTITANLTGNVTGNVSGTATNVTGTVAVANGGTGATNANDAFNNLAPSQASNTNKILKTNGTNASWVNINEIFYNNGTTASPSIGFAGDPDSGFYHPAVGVIALSNNGTESLRVDAVGRVGIGTIGPSEKLDVNGNIKVEKIISQGVAPTVSNGELSATVDGNDSAMVVTFSGATVSAANVVLATITFSTAFINPPVCVWSRASANSGTLNPFIESVYNDKIEIKSLSATSVAAGSKINIICIGK